MNKDPTLKPDIAALQNRLAEDPCFAAQVTGDRPPAPGCHTPEGCRENGCLGWCDEHRPEAVPDSKTPNVMVTAPAKAQP